VRRLVAALVCGAQTSYLVATSRDFESGNKLPHSKRKFGFATTRLFAMNPNSNQTPPQSRQKCGNCGLVNTGADELCRRCGSPLDDNAPAEQQIEPTLSEEAGPKKRSLLKRLVWIAGATLISLLIFYLSLLITSDGLQADQREAAQKAIAVLEQHGFNREAFVLKHLTVFRSTDNWWNRYIGHRDAYAATNFPFEVVTLYPEFFNVPVDDNERAAVLLHEASHLLGGGEEDALSSAWRSKQRLGWTADRYKQTRLWNATEQLTKAQFPYMFKCGVDGQSDCF
jgi:hypothetical protein